MTKHTTGWTKARRSYGEGACVEVRGTDGAIEVRDSKNPDGPRLSFTPPEWDAFREGVRAGDFDHL